MFCLVSPKTVPHVRLVFGGSSQRSTLGFLDGGLNPCAASMSGKPPLRIDELAARVQMSPSTLHHHFRTLTAMSPLQFQKWLRLNEARRMMLAEDLDVAAAALQVGYESPSQFSHEYSRLFGLAPSRDIARLRQSPAVAEE